MKRVGLAALVWGCLFAAAACSDPAPGSPGLADSVPAGKDAAPPDSSLDLALDQTLAPDAWTAAAAPPVTLPRASVTASELGLIVNTQDPISVELAAYYQIKRGITAANTVKLSFPANADVMKPADFSALKAKVDAALGPGVQVLALTWYRPYRVGCMSITSAFALGYGAAYCNDKAVSGKSCGVTAPVKYYMSDSTRPFSDFKIRPAMAIASVTAAQGKQVIDRGLAAEATLPPGTGWMVRTTDKARSVRYTQFQTSVTQLGHSAGITLNYIDNGNGSSSANLISGKKQVLFYFTGLTSVGLLTSNTYRPGAVADHLTSFGGKLVPPGTAGQMSAMRWLEAGLTGSYGTVVEPCNYSQKFPDTRIFMPYYFRGNTLVEAYWKSVSWPGEGVFIGDPLARPFGTQVSYGVGNKSLKIRTTILKPMTEYQLWGVSPSTGKEELVQGGIKVQRYQFLEIKVASVRHKAYRLAAK